MCEEDWGQFFPKFVLHWNVCFLGGRRCRCSYLSIWTCIGLLQLVGQRVAMSYMNTLQTCWWFLDATNSKRWHMSGAENLAPEELLFPHRVLWKLKPVWSSEVDYLSLCIRHPHHCYVSYNLTGILHVCCIAQSFLPTHVCINVHVDILVHVDMAVF